mgnify:CR=1 FL=1
MQTIGRRLNSISRVYYIEEINRKVNQIHFYNDNVIIASTTSGWLSADNKFQDRSGYDIQDIKITKELKNFKANYNLEKATANIDEDDAMKLMDKIQEKQGEIII